MRKKIALLRLAGLIGIVAAVAVLSRQTDSFRIAGRTSSGRTVRLAAHEFIPVGQTRSLGNIGQVLEVLELGDGPTIKFNPKAGTVACQQGGLACIRARYRQTSTQNNVQTKCIACVDETGSCRGKKAIQLNLQQFTNRAGNANWLETGSQSLYGICSVQGKVRLQQPPANLPSLYWTMVDAHGDGAYSLGADEYAAQRAGLMRNYSNKELAPPWIIALTPEIKTVNIDSKGRMKVNDFDCQKSPGCSLNADLIKDGDIVEVGAWPDPAPLIERTLPRIPAAHITALLRTSDVKAFNLTDLSKHPHLKQAAISRLAKLQMADQVLRFFDSAHNLRQKKITLALRKHLDSQALTSTCPLPDEEMVNLCSRIEKELMRIEAKQVSSWKKDGFNLWGWVELGPVKLSHRPEPSIFRGLIASYSVASGKTTKETWLKENLPKRLDDYVKQINALAPGKPVIIETSSPPLTTFTEGTACEAAYCPADFRYSFNFMETAFQTFRRSLRNRLTGFSVALFEGAHFDILEPVEKKSGYELNRVGETGYNTPFLNVYATQ